MEGEIEFSKTAQFTWLPVRDYFETYRQNRDLIGMLDETEAELLTATMHIMEERMGYIVRKSERQQSVKHYGDAVLGSSKADILPDLGPPIGQNIRLDYDSDDERADLQSDLYPILEAARAAREAINKNLIVSAPMLTRPPKRDPTRRGQ
jgi:hypothetical protein